MKPTKSKTEKVLLVLSVEPVTALLSKNWPADPITENGRIWGRWGIFTTLEQAQDFHPSTILDVLPCLGEGYGEKLAAERKHLLKWAQEEGLPIIKVDSKEILNEAGTEYSLLSLWLEEAPCERIIDVFQSILMRKASSDEGEEGGELPPSPLELVSVLPFPWKVVPRELRDCWLDLAQAVSVPPEAVAILGLGAIGGLLGNRVLVQPKHGWKEHLALWSVFVKPTGFGGTPLLQALMSPIYKRQAEAWEIYQKALRAWEEIPAKDREEPRPTLKSYHVQDTTIEALARTLTQNPQGVLLDADELAGFFRGLAQYKNHRKGNDLEHLLSMWSGKAVKFDRVTSDPLYIPSPSLGIVGGIQPGVLTRLFQTEEFENGLVPRFLFYVSQGPPPPLSARGWEKKEIWETLINKLIEASWDIEAIFSQESLKELMAFDAELKQIGPYLPNKLAVFLPKAITYAVRLSGILHVLEALEEGKDPSRVVKVNTTKKGIQLARFYLGQARLVVELYGSKVQLMEQERLLVEAILEQRNRVRKGKVPLSFIGEAYNRRAPALLQLSSRALGSAIRKLGETLGVKLTTTLGRYEDKAKVSCLVWDPHVIFTLKKTSTTSTTSTNHVSQGLTHQKDIHTTSTTSTNHSENVDVVENTWTSKGCVNSPGTRDVDVVDVVDVEHKGNCKTDLDKEQAEKEEALTEEEVLW